MRVGLKHCAIVSGQVLLLAAFCLLSSSKGVAQLPCNHTRGTTYFDGQEFGTLGTNNWLPFENSCIQSYHGANGGHYSTFVLQEDGDLVMYDVTGHPRWASTPSCGGNSSCMFYHLAFQRDANLVLYNDVNGAVIHGGTTAAPIPTGTDLANRAVLLVAQDDGNVVLYRQNGTGCTHGSKTASCAVWSTHTRYR